MRTKRKTTEKQLAALVALGEVVLEMQATVADGVTAEAHAMADSFSTDLLFMVTKLREIGEVLAEAPHVERKVLS